MLQFLHNISRVVKDGIHTFDLVDRDLSDYSPCTIYDKAKCNELICSRNVFLMAVLKA